MLATAAAPPRPAPPAALRGGPRCARRVGGLSLPKCWDFDRKKEGGVYARRVFAVLSEPIGACVRRAAGLEGEGAIQSACSAKALRACTRGGECLAKAAASRGPRLFSDGV